MTSSAEECRGYGIVCFSRRG